MYFSCLKIQFPLSVRLPPPAPYSTIAALLSELTKKAKPNKVIWEEKHENSFIELKSALNKAPILRLPDVNREFVLQTDPSDVGI